MATTDIKLVIQAKDEASKTLSSVSKSIEGLSKTTASFGKSFGVEMNIMSAGLKAVTAGVGALSASFAGFIGYGLKTAGDMESARQGFKALLGSAEEADAVMTRIKAEAKATPFELPGLIEGTQALTAITKDGDKAIDILLNVGKAVAMSGKGQEEMSRVIFNLQQVASTGKLTEMDIRQFQGAIPIFNDIIEASGMTVAQLKESANASELLFKAFAKAGAEGGMTYAGFIEQAGTFNQLWSNVGDSITILSADVVKQTGIFDIAKQGMSAFISTIEQNQEAIVSFIKNGVDIAIKKAKEWYDSMGGIDGIKQRLFDLWNVIVNKVVPAFLSIASALGSFMAFVNENNETIARLFVAFEALKGIMFITSVVKGLITVFSALQPVAIAVGTFIAGISAPVWIAIAVITALIAIGVLLWNNWDWLSAKATEIWAKIVETWNAIPEKAREIFSSLGSFFVNIWNGISTSIKNAVDYLGTNIPIWFEAVVNFFKELPDNIRKVVFVVGTKIGEAFISAGEWVGTNVPIWFDAVVNYFKELPGRIFDALGSLGEKIGEAFKNAFEWVKNNWSTFTKGFGEGFQEALELAGLKFADGGIVPRFATGGIVGNSSFGAVGTDTVPAMLTPGEMVLNASQQKNLFSLLKSGVGGGSREVNVNFNNVTVRNDSDLDQIIKAVKASLGREQELSRLGAF